MGRFRLLSRQFYRVMINGWGGTLWLYIIITFTATKEAWSVMSENNIV